MDQTAVPAAVVAAEAAPRAVPSSYPAEFAERLAGRVKCPLGDLFGLRNFGVNLTRLPPGASSTLHHVHARQDEFVYVLEGTPTLVRGTDEVLLSPGMCAGFAGGSEAHHLVNRSGGDVVILEVGDRTAGDTVAYPADDLAAALGPDGRWVYTRKDGSAL
jgi:uncharacterized cupin superfamily protein